MVGAVATLVIDNPAKRNSLDFVMLEQLHDHASALANDPQIKVVIIRGGDEKAFCAGADFDAFAQHDPISAGVLALDSALNRAIAALERLQVPIIAAIEGACFGGGILIALAADVRVASTASRFGIPAVQIGMAYPLPAIARIVQLAGRGAANHIFLTAQPFGPDVALLRGLVDEVVPTEDFEPHLARLAESVTSSPAEAVRSYKAIIADLSEAPISDKAAHVHHDLEEAAFFVPKLQEIAARRKK
jgi:enoyl-CoA hydratase/carnithine racemase